MEAKNFMKQYNSSCRVCLLNSNDGVGMSALFTTTYQSLYLFDMMSSCTSIEIKPDDGLPSLLCTKCMGSLIAACEFQKQCHKTDLELRIELGIPLTTPNTENKIVEIDIKMPILTINSDITIKNEEMSATNLIDEELDSKDDVKSIEENEFAINDPCDVKPKLEFVTIRSACATDHQKFEGTAAVVDSSNDVEDERPMKLPTTRKNKKSFQCLVCKKEFNRSYSLRRHSSVHDDHGKPFECEVCKIRFVSESSLIRHALRHDNIFTLAAMEDNPPESLSYKCKYCEKTFDKSHKLSRHYITCHEEFKQHKCTICDTKFAFTSQLRGHLCGHKDKKPFVCRVCDKGFLQAYALTYHMKTHSKDTPFLCSECGKGFHNNANLRQHLLRHTGDKPHVCKECPSRFVTRGGLASHMSTHTQLKPHICDLCGSKFAKPHSLTKHKRIHTDHRPFPCEMCDKRFLTSVHMKTHFRTHSGEKPYKCEFCDRAFAQNYDFVKHTRTHVGDKTYQCKDCSAAFRFSRELKQHSHIHFLAIKKSRINATANASLPRSAELVN